MNYLQRQNAACRIEWQRRVSYEIKYRDIREYVVARALDESYAMQRMVAKVLAEDIVAEKLRKSLQMQLLLRQANNVFYLRKQAS